MAQAVLHHWLCVFALQLSLLAPVRGSSDSSSYANLSTAFPPLQDLDNFPLHRDPRLGGQNFTVCCLLAVNQSYQIQQDGQVSQAADPQSRFINLTPDQLNNTQFPCGATYNNNDTGAPLVTIPYSWCASNCGGWQQSTNRILTQWIQPFVGFILPAAVFCLNVPRKKVLAISDKLFRGRLNALLSSLNEIKFDGFEQGKILRNIVRLFIKIVKFLVFLVVAVVETVFRGSWAASIAFSDTIIWVGIVFSTAAPMILSGLYEATLDRKIIEKVQNQSLIVGTHPSNLLYLEIHLLYATLVGNLSLNHPKADIKESNSEDRSAWADTVSLVAPFALPQDPGIEDKNITQIPKIDDKNRVQIRNGTKLRLKGMLECQASFGAAIGAPVVFFLGSFFFSVFSNLSTVGDNDTSHALAFGMWWMTIPHVAIVSGCLLAGNNPNTLEVIICGISPWDYRIRERNKDWWHYLNLYRSFYASVYQPVWMWERGRSKRNWVRRVQKEFEDKMPPGDKYEDRSEDEWLPKNDNFKLDLWDWALLIIVALVLMAAPLILAFLTSFYTPTVGLSCRSFTFLLYFLFQVWISLIWLWDFRRKERYPLTKQWTLLSDKKRTVPTIYCVLMAFGLIGSAFTAIAGTFMQILGVYRNCLCRIPISAWSSRDYSIVISTNSIDDIHYAEHFWLPTGITSIVVLVFVCYVGWWYQRHWRRRFQVVIDKLRTGEEPSRVAEQLFVKQQTDVIVNPAAEVNGAGNPDLITSSN